MIANTDDRYVIASKPVNVSDQQLHAVMGAPVEELISEVMRHSHNAWLVSAFIALASLPIIYFVAQLIARPLNELSLEARKLKNFNLAEPITTRSRVREVQRLADAMRAAKAGLATFGLYVPKELVRQVLASGNKPSLGGEERDLTIMFLDLHGFTSFAERSTPKEITQLLSDFFSRSPRRRSWRAAAASTNSLATVSWRSGMRRCSSPITLSEPANAP